MFGPFRRFITYFLLLPLGFPNLNCYNIFVFRQHEACTTFEELSGTAQSELKMQKERRVAHFQKSLQELAELEVKHAKAHAQMLRQTINAIKTEV